MTEAGGMRPVVQQRGHLTTTRVLDATLDILGERGAQGVTIAAVSQRSGVANGSIYHRFGDRRQLLVAAHGRFLSRLSESSESDSAEWFSAEDRHQFLTGFVDMFLTAISDNRTLIFAFVSLGRDDPDMWTAGMTWSRSLAQRFTHILVERFGCSLEASDTAFRMVYSYALLPAMFGDDEISTGATSSADRARHLVTAVEAVADQY
ncbi:TetR/AcrR family transcriptional regulator [Mycobacteriaceae bacterium NPDC060252]